MTKPYRVGFTCGSFDLMHAGHVMMLEDCKNHCLHLVVGLQTDPTIDRPGKNKPVQSLPERMVVLEACRHVDEVIIYSTEAELVALLERVRPDVRFVGEDWKGKPFTGHELRIPVIYNDRGHGLSTSELRRRVRAAEEAKG